MTIKFDIAGVSPTADDISAERARLEGRLRRVTRLGWTVIGLLVLLDAGLWLAWWQGGMVSNGILAAAAVVGAVGGVLVGIAFAFAFAVSLASVGAVGAVVAAGGGADAAAAVGAPFVGVVVGRAACGLWSDARTRLREALALLDPAPREACVDIADWSRQDHAVDTYRAAVVNQGRQITRREYLAMKDWVEGATARRATEEKQREVDNACRKVYGVRVGA
jgi:hypothetical protein